MKDGYTIDTLRVSSAEAVHPNHIAINAGKHRLVFRAGSALLKTFLEDNGADGPFPNLATAVGRNIHLYRHVDIGLPKVLAEHELRIAVLGP